MSALRNDSFAPGAVHHPIDQAVLNRFCRGKEVVAVGVFGDFLQGLAGVFGHQTVEGVFQEQDLLGLDLDVDSLAFISIDGLYRAVGLPGRDNDQPQFCDACFSGDYPISLTDRDEQPAPSLLTLLDEQA